jgi:nitroreductase
MDILELIKTRRSIRKFDSEKSISDELIHKILTAAMYAPSAGNQQVWHFVVIKDKTTFEQINEFHPFSSMLKQSGMAILVCGDSSIETKKGYWPIDCAAATQNMLLAAHGLGLGAVWLGIYPVPERQLGISKLLNLPEYIHPFSLIAFGFPAEEKKTPERFKPERIHSEKW